MKKAEKVSYFKSQDTLLFVPVLLRRDCNYERKQLKMHTVLSSTSSGWLHSTREDEPEQLFQSSYKSSHILIFDTRFSDYSHIFKGTSWNEEKIFLLSNTITNIKGFNSPILRVFPPTAYVVLLLLPNTNCMSFLLFFWTCYHTDVSQKVSPDRWLCTKWFLLVNSNPSCAVLIWFFYETVRLTEESLLWRKASTCGQILLVSVPEKLCSTPLLLEGKRNTKIIFFQSQYNLLFPALHHTLL